MNTLENYDTVHCKTIEEWVRIITSLPNTSEFRHIKDVLNGNVSNASGDDNYKTWPIIMYDTHQAAGFRRIHRGFNLLSEREFLKKAGVKSPIKPIKSIMKHKFA